MIKHRRLLYWGVFFIVTGAVVLVAGTSLVSDADVKAALGLWPVLVIALGIGLLLRRTRFDLAGGMLAAATPGLLLGGLIAIAPEIPGDCTSHQPATTVVRQGTFGTSATVDLRLSCGEMNVVTAPGSAWQAEVGNSRGRVPAVTSDAGRLSVASADRGSALFSRPGDDSWRLTLPTGSRLDVTAEINAGRGFWDLAGARIGNLGLDVNAGEARIDLTRATVSGLSVTLNAASVSLRLPETGDLRGDVTVNAGALRMCAPASLGVRVFDSHRSLASIRHGGLVRNGDAWETPGYATAVHHADVSVTANVGSVDINPEGGCR